jgi:carboxymethylenebutenolidase
MSEVSFHVTGGERIGYLARPRGAGPWPGVVLIHEIFGLNADIRKLSDRFADTGYLALAPDFYAGGKWRKCMRVAFQQLAAREGEFFDAVDAAREWLASQEDCTGRIGVIGFCLGGGFALLCAPRYDFGAAAVNYGEVPEDAARILSGACPIVASYGGRDRTLRGRPERLQRALDLNQVEHDLKVYPDAGHGFLAAESWPTTITVLGKLMGMHPGPHEPSARNAWQRIDAFFDAHLRS